MKRDWDLLRKQLTDIEEERDLLADFPDEPKYETQTWEEYEQQLKEFKTIENRLGGHLELLVENGYIDGLQVIRSLDGGLHFGVSNPRLTMAGHDLLDTMRSSTVWDSIKTTAKDKGIELTFDSIKALGTYALSKLLGS
ncbi:MAG: DUF2513 domain-containing protein [Gallionellaceae bacterium]|jgi:hypothetical protein